MTNLLRTTILVPTLFVFSVMTIWVPASNAALLSTESADANQFTATTDGSAIQAFLLKETVRQQLVQLGVSPELAMARAATLTPAERLLLEQKIAELPAGAGVVEVLGIVFIVLLILELLGVTDIFKKF